MVASLERFAELVSREQFALAEACLLVAQDEYPALDVQTELGRLDAIAARIRDRLPADAFPEQRVAALNFHLFRELGFRGNTEAYYDPRNSYLNDVLARRVGIPITLSVVYLEVGRRIGLRLQGVSFPGHFLVALRLRRGRLVLDPFAGGELRTEGELRERLEQMLPAGRAREIDLAPYLEPTAPREILARVLRNLKDIHLRGERPERALAVMSRLILVLPESPDELRDRGLLYQRLECFRPALADLQSYLRRVPAAADAADVRVRVADLKAACARLN